MLGRKAGGVLFCGDLDLGSDAARGLTTLQFSAVLSARRPPMWNAGRDTLLFLQRELPQPKKRFGILLQAPWDRAYKGRLEDQMKPNPIIVPQDQTSAREVAMGPDTLVVAQQVRARTEAAPRPTRGAAREAKAPAADAAKGRGDKRPKSFAEDWSAEGSVAPPTTMANPPADLMPAPPRFRPVPMGPGFARLDVAVVGGLPSVDYFWGGIDLSPDGREVAFAWNRTGAYELYSAPLASDRIIQLTGADTRSISPRWSPDGNALAFMRDSGGTERFAIWIVDRDGDHERKLTTDDALTHRDLAWSPDGRSIACVANVGGGRFGIQVLDVATGARRALTDGAFDDSLPRFSPDGAWILFGSRRTGARVDADLYLVSVSGGDAVRLETRDGTGGDSEFARWSPDGRSIAFTSNARGRREIAVVDLDGAKAVRLRYLTTDPFDEHHPVWRPDARGVLYLQDKDASRAIHRAFTASRAATPVADLPGVYDWTAVGPDSETIAMTFTSARRPADVWVRDPDQATSRQLTDSLGGKIDPNVLVEPAHVRYPGADGREVPALLYMPHAEATGGRTPGAVIYVHGGPTGQHYRWWDPTPQLLANRGLVVLAPNVRGSTGYGREWQELNRHDWGGGDLADVMAGVDWLAKERIADPAHVGITGGSYGGYMTLYALGRYPTRFAAGVSSVGVVSWKTLFDTTRGDLREYLMRELGDATKEPALYAERSPITYAKNIRAALLVLQGANDPRVPKAEALQIVEALKANAAPHQYHEYADEGHGFARIENRVDALRRTVDWLSQYLTPLMDRYLTD